MLKYRYTKTGFTITEMLIVVSIITILTTASLASFRNSLARGRDLQRIEDMKTIATAIQAYTLDHQNLPNETYSGSFYYAGWESSAFPNFLEYLVNEGYLDQEYKDPINIQLPGIVANATRPDGNYFYAYHYYNWLQACPKDPIGGCTPGEYYGCDFDGPLAVLAFRSVEAIDPDNLPKSHCGKLPCAFGPGGGENLGTVDACRDWSNEFDYSILIPM